MAGRNQTVAEERHRCLRLVTNYRKKMEEIMLVCQRLDDDHEVPINGAWVKAEDCYKIAQAVQKSLSLIEAKIVAAKPKADDLGNFTLEEIDAAMAIMAEQDCNPFD